MNVLMFTNTYTPHVGGVARSVGGLVQGLRTAGHQVGVVAPTFEGMPTSEADVSRVPALQHFRGSDFSVPMPVGHRLKGILDAFAPDLIHAHHPFLLGDTALHAAAARNLPLVFTYHTRYEYYSHYAPADSPRLKRLALELALGYCELCDAVIAPSESVAAFLLAEGVESRIEVIPTGVRLEQFADGDGRATRRATAIPEDAFIVGHVGRLAPEKNLSFLTQALTSFLLEHPKAHCLIVGVGPMRAAIVDAFEQLGLGRRLHFMGVVDSRTLADAYRAMDVFAFSSHTETQGLVLAEAMAAGVPVVALDAPGAREIVRDSVNGRLLAQEDQAAFVAALDWVARQSPQGLEQLRRAARETAKGFSFPRTVEQVLTLYRSLLAMHPAPKRPDESTWASTRRRLRVEWKHLNSVAHAVEHAMLQPLPEGPESEPHGHD